MRLRVLTIKNVEMAIEVESEDTILGLKEKIFEQNSDLCVSNQKLIHRGVVLKDDQRISDYENIRENERVLVVKGKTYTQKTSSVSTPQNTQNESIKVTSEGTTTPPIQINPPNIQNLSSNTSNTPNLPNTHTHTLINTNQSNTQNTHTQNTHTQNIHTQNSHTQNAHTQNTQTQNTHIHTPNTNTLNEQELENSIQILTSMGFSQSAARGALIISGNNPQAAIDLLTDIGDESSIPLAPINDLTPEHPEDAFPMTPSMPPGNSLDFLRNMPDFDRLRESLRGAGMNDPHFQAQFLEQLGRMSPELPGLIQGQEEELVNLLFGEQNDDEADGVGDDPTGAGQGLGQGSPQTVTISLTQNEMISVERLEALGFTRAEVLEAFLACDKNEELAANYLFDTFN